MLNRIILKWNEIDSCDTHISQYTKHIHAHQLMYFKTWFLIGFMIDHKFMKVITFHPGRLGWIYRSRKTFFLEVDILIIRIDYNN